MRFIAELFVFIVLIALCWEKSFSERLGDAIPALAKTSPLSKPSSQLSVRAPISQATVSATPTGAWMWDPKRKGSLDRPTSPTPVRP